MSQITGNLSFDMTTDVFSLFVQDDWQIAPTVKMLYGVRYDLYKYPAGIADAPLAQTHEFNTDKNNFGPRVGVAWSIDPKTVLRASTGIMYDQPILGGYEQALQLSGSPRSPVYSLQRHVGRARRRSPPVRRPARCAAVAVGGRSGLRGRAHVADERSVRALARPRSHGVGLRSCTRRAPSCRSSPTST